MYFAKTADSIEIRLRWWSGGLGGSKLQCIFSAHVASNKLEVVQVPPVADCRVFLTTSLMGSVTWRRSEAG